MGKSNSKLKPEVVEELTRKTYCKSFPPPLTHFDTCHYFLMCA